MDFMDELLRVNPEVGVQRVRGRLLAAGPGDVLHSFEGADGQVSEVAERIVELADGSRTLKQIVSALCEEFEVSEAICAADTEKFAQLLLEREVLVPAKVGAGRP